MWFKKQNEVEQNDLRIVEFINKFGKKSYGIEKYRKWGKYLSMWFTEKIDIDTYEKAVKIKSEIEHQIKSEKIISYLPIKI